MNDSWRLLQEFPHFTDIVLVRTECIFTIAPLEPMREALNLPVLSSLTSCFGPLVLLWTS